MSSILTICFALMIICVVVFVINIKKISLAIFNLIKEIIEVL